MKIISSLEGEIESEKVRERERERERERGGEKETNLPGQKKRELKPHIK